MRGINPSIDKEDLQSPLSQALPSLGYDLGSQFGTQDVEIRPQYREIDLESDVIALVGYYQPPYIHGRGMRNHFQSVRSSRVVALNKLLILLIAIKAMEDFLKMKTQSYTTSYIRPSVPRQISLDVIHLHCRPHLSLTINLGGEASKNLILLSTPFQLLQELGFGPRFLSTSS